MEKRLFLIGIVIATVVSGGAFLAVLFAASPDSSGLAVKVLFFISLALFLTWLLSIVLYWRGKFSSDAKKNELLGKSLKDASLFSVWFVGFMALSAIFGFVPGGIIAILTVGIFISKKRNLFRRKR